MNQTDIVTKKKQIEWSDLNSALLLEVKREKNIFTSSSVAIAPQVILTAAHSVEGIDSAKIFLDSHYKGDSKNFIRVADVIIHPDYAQSESNFLNDIAILILEKPLPQNIKIYPIHEGNLLKGELSRIGFGERAHINARNWTNPRYIAHPCDHRYFMCEDTFSVVGDSGGPLFIKSGRGLKLAGIHSTLEGKSLTYAVKVDAYKKWIHKVLEKTYFNLLSSSSSMQR